MSTSSSLHLQSVPRLLLPPSDTSSSLAHLIPNGTPSFPLAVSSHHYSSVSVDTNLLVVPSPGSAYKLSPDSSRQPSSKTVSSFSSQ